MKITLTATRDDNGKLCYEWGFDFGGEHFGGYCRTRKDALSDARAVAFLKEVPSASLASLTASRILDATPA